ncbi:MAG TPA: hypothetical protein VMU67_12850 [Steroidobacteraceae bacterium]|nr:hypothetical protein [Steroidobacteraceae bacterium]
MSAISARQRRKSSNALLLKGATMTLCRPPAPELVSHREPGCRVPKSTGTPLK